MGICSLNSPFVLSFYLLLLALFACSSSEQLMSDNPIQDITCALVNCGQGVCKDSNASILGFDCECYPGWKKIQIGPLIFPSCVLPNCTIDFGCGNGSPPSPPPPAPPIPPPINFSDPCNLTWCGDGICASNGTGHTCQCYQGSSNLFNNTAFACLKQCTLGVDCNGLGLGQPSPTPSPTKSGSPGNDSYNVVPPPTPTPAAPNSSSKLRVLTMILLSAILHTWF